MRRPTKGTSAFALCLCFGATFLSFSLGVEVRGKWEGKEEGRGDSWGMGFLNTASTFQLLEA
eukprot:62504-Prorocentrum_lima.AAC.1